jgi:hypothetical protein
MKSFLAVIIFLLLVVKAIEGLPFTQSESDAFDKTAREAP